MLLGIHVSKTLSVDKIDSKGNVLLDGKQVSRDLHQALIEDTNMLGINSAQIFTHGPQYFVKNKYDVQGVIDATKEIDLTVHSAYISTGIWKVTRKNKDTPESKKRINIIVKQLKACKEINAWGLVIHLVKTLPANIAETMKVLKPYAKKYGVKIILEMTASKSHIDQTYESPEKLDNLVEQIGLEDWYGLCIDTAHIWAGGQDIQTYEQMSNWFSRFVHKKKILLFHLNGSSCVQAGGKDKHEIAFGPDDKIWKKIKPKESGVKAIVEHALEHQVPIICEVNRGKLNDLIKSLNLIKEL